MGCKRHHWGIPHFEENTEGTTIIYHCVYCDAVKTIIRKGQFLLTKNSCVETVKEGKGNGRS